MAEYFLSKLSLSREHLCGGLKLCPQTQFYTTTRNIPFFPLKKKWLLKQMVIRYGVDTGKSEMLATESKQ